MKRYILLFAIALIASCTSGEQQVNPVNVPHEVLSAFDVKYPHISKSMWFKGSENSKVIYKAQWRKDGKIIRADFDGQGVFLKEEQ